MVKPSTTWIRSKLIGDKVAAVNAGFEPYFVTKNKVDLLLLQRLNHLSMSLDCWSNVFFTVTPPSAKNRLLMMDYFPGQSFFQTCYVAPRGQLLYNFVNKKNSLFYITVATATLE